MEGLVGLLIMIIVLNLGARLLRALSAGQRKSGPRGPKIPDRVIREAQQRSRPAGGEPAGAESVGDSARWHEDDFERRGAETVEDFEKWSEERFEKSIEEKVKDIESWSEKEFESLEKIFGYQKKPEPEPTILDVPRKKAEKPSKVKIPAMVTPARRIKPSTTVQETSLPSVYADLADVQGLRKAIVLTTVLGTCRAKRRHRV